MMLPKAIFLAAVCSLVGQTSAIVSTCEKKKVKVLKGGIEVEVEEEGLPGDRIKNDGVEGIYDDECNFWQLEPKEYHTAALQLSASQANAPQAQAMQQAQASSYTGPGNNPDNPASFCGRPAPAPTAPGSTFVFDPYYLTPGGPVSSGGYSMAAAAANPPPITLMQVAFPHYTTVTITYPGSNGSPDVTVTGLLDDHCNMIFPEPSASGDPHFKTWGGDRFDFHGGCDLVLLKNEDFASGRGFKIHTRTHIKTWWSYIEAIVIQIGENTMEISGAEGGWIWLNGEKDGHGIESGDAALGDYSFHSRRVNAFQTITRVDLGDKNAISIETFKHFVRVNLKPSTQASFYGSTGLLGSFPEGKMVARDGVTMMEDANEYGQEWMVHPSEPMLFHDFTASEHPHKCTMPDQEQKKEARRRLGELAITEMDAAQACSRVTDGSERDLCIFDVMATNDKDIAGSY